MLQLINQMILKELCDFGIFVMVSAFQNLAFEKKKKKLSNTIKLLALVCFKMYIASFNEIR